MHVVERSVRPGLARPAAVEPRIPPLDQLLDRADVDASVVQVLLDLREVRSKESPVHADRVAAQRHSPRLGDMRLDELQRLRACVGQRDRRGCGSRRAVRSSCASRRRRDPSRPAPHRLDERRDRDPPRRCSDRRRSPTWRSRRSRAEHGSRPVISRSIHTSTAARLRNALPSPAMADTGPCPPSRQQR